MYDPGCGGTWKRPGGAQAARRVGAEQQTHRRSKANRGTPVLISHFKPEQLLFDLYDVVLLRSKISLGQRYQGLKNILETIAVSAREPWKGLELRMARDRFGD